ncbi:MULTISPECIES: hypothetical protein [Neobacillus]|uniref:hypothetical protein n=1 Tax=Neobacillus TaxID=2675232 RepID=UPI002017199F|nr:MULTISPECIES: hypothetical protein [Neobacillus]
MCSQIFIFTSLFNYSNVVRFKTKLIVGIGYERDKKEFGLKRVIKLASNENPLGPSPKAIEAISGSLTGLNRYPDAHAIELKKIIASWSRHYSH